MKTKVVTGLLLASAMVGVARADDTRALMLDDEPEIVISAPRSSRVVEAPPVQQELVQPPREILHTGRPVTVISSEEIERSGARQVLEVLRDVPGIRVTQFGSFGGRTSVSSRGAETSNNLVLLDGVKVNAPGGDYNWNALPTDNIDRIEIVRGPAAFALGGDGSSAVIQIFTKRGQGPPRYTLAAEAGSFSTFSEDVSGLGTTGPANWSFSLSQLNTEGHLPINNDYGRAAASGRIDLPVSDRTDVQVTLNHFSDKFEVATDVGGDLLPPFFLDPDGAVRVTSTAMGARVEREMRDNWTVGLSLENFLGTSFNRDPRDSPADATPFFSEQETRRQSAELRSDHEWRGWKIGVGGEFEREEVHGVSVSGAAPTTTHFGRLNSAGYISLAGEIRENLSLSAGVRLDENTRLHREWSAGGGLQYLYPRTRTTLRLSGGQGFKYPTIAQVASQTATFLPNQNLKAEHELSGEFGIDQPFWNDRWQASVTGFWAHSKDMIGNVRVPGTTVSTPMNLSRVERVGAEATLSLKITPRWKISGNYTYLETEVKDAGPVSSNAFLVGDAVTRRPKHTGNATLAYNGERLRGEINVNAVGKSIDRDFSNNPVSFRLYVPGYAKVDASLEYDMTENLTLTAAGNNILDKDYQENYGFSNPPANWRGGVKWNF